MGLIDLVDIRASSADDRPAIEQVVAAAFGEPVGGPVTLLLRALDASTAARVGLVAVDGARVVGHVQLSRAWVDARQSLVDVVVLSPLSVVPDRQGAGIGTALVGAALVEAESRGAPAVFLEGSSDYYGRRGFRPATAAGFRRPSARIPERAFQVALLPAYEPWMTGRLVYPDAFWSTDTVGLRDPYLAEVEGR